MNPFDPYHDLESLLIAAGISVADMDNYTLEQMLVKAEERSRAPAPSRDSLPIDGPPFATRTIRLPVGLILAVDARANVAKSTFNAVSGKLLLDWVRSK